MTDAEAVAQAMPDSVKLIIVALAMDPPSVGETVNDPGLIEFLDDLVGLGIAVAVSAGTGRRFHLTRFGRDIFDIVKGQPCNL